MGTGRQRGKVLVKGYVEGSVRYLFRYVPILQFLRQKIYKSLRDLWGFGVVCLGLSDLRADVVCGSVAFRFMGLKVCYCFSV